MDANDYGEKKVSIMRAS